jgi:flagellar hook-associated protein 1 FlgK
MATTIAQLNAGIDTAVNGSLNPSDLLDQRDKLINQLGELTGVTTRDGRNGMVDVFINGNAIVRGRDASSIHMQKTATGAVLKWDLDGSAVNASTGKVAALLDAANTTIPGYLSKLDAIAKTFISTVNNQQKQGVDLNSAPSSTPSTNDLLSGTGASDIDVDPAMTPDLVAAAAVNGGRLDGSNALALAEMGTSPTGPDQAYRSFIDSLGVDVQRASRQSDIQGEITRQTDAATQSAAGVNLDEEMANMIAFQHAYDAAARFMTAVDQQLDTLIHSTGLVGR